MHYVKFYSVHLVRLRLAKNEVDYLFRFKKCLSLQCKLAGQCGFMCVAICANAASLPPTCNPQMKRAALVPFALVYSSLGFALR